MNGTAKQPGVIPQTIYDCFDYITTMTDREFLFRVSYLEIYNETINDLLNPQPVQIKIMHDPKLGTVLQGVKEQIVMTAEQVIALLQGGEAHRHVGSTDMNEKSSRAHTLFRLIVESKLAEGGPGAGPRGTPRSKSGGVGGVGGKGKAASGIRVSTLNLIDLAGSENAKMANTAGTGERGREGKYINQSLLALSTIIQRLSEEKAGGPKQHIPYRDSKLTRILQAPLSGNAMICMICTVSPGRRCADESHNTLKFASRAKLITVEAKINETFDEKALLRKYREEIDDLQAKLAAMESMVQATKSIKTREEDESDEEDSNKQEIMLQMIDHMERLILKGGPGAAAAVAAAASRPRGSSGDHFKTGGGGISPRGGFRSGLLQGSKSTSDKELKSPSGSTDNTSAGAGAGAGGIERTDTLDDPFNDQPSSKDTGNGKGDGVLEDYFVGRQRNNSLVGNGNGDIVGVGSNSGELKKPIVGPARPSLMRSMSLMSDGNILAPSRAAVEASGDSALLGVSQMLSLLRGQVTKKHHHNHDHNHVSRTLDDHDLPKSAEKEAPGSQQKRRHSLLSKSTSGMPDTGDPLPSPDVPFQPSPSSPYSSPFASARKGARPSKIATGSAVSITPEAKRADQLELDLKLKNADNTFLQEELRKAMSQIDKKDRILSMLTDGLKEVYNLCYLFPKRIID
jgi:hypothetical protein